MTITEFLEYLSKPADYRSETFTEADITKLANTDKRVCATKLTFLFVHEKTLHDPSPKVKEIQDRLRSRGANEEFIFDMSSKLQQTEFFYEFSVQEGIRDALHSKQHYPELRNNPEYKESTLEWYYDLENF